MTLTLRIENPPTFWLSLAVARLNQKVGGFSTKTTDALRKAGRDDLMVPVTRAATSEYITPERLDEAIGIVYGKSRQGLIGQ